MQEKKQSSNNGHLHQRIFSHFLQVHLQMSLLMFYIDGNIYLSYCVCVKLGYQGWLNWLNVFNFIVVLQLYIDEVMQLKY